MHLVVNWTTIEMSANYMLLFSEIKIFREKNFLVMLQSIDPSFNDFYGFCFRITSLKGNLCLVYSLIVATLKLKINLQHIARANRCNEPIRITKF